MERYYRVDPEVPGGFGDRTVIRTDRVPWTVEHLHYAFDDWLGDVPIASHPVFMVTQAMAERLSRSGATGFALREMEVSTSPASEDLHPDVDLTLPTFQWLDAKGKLVVSERALRWLREGQLAWCEIEEVWPEDGRV